MSNPPGHLPDYVHGRPGRATGRLRAASLAWLGVAVLMCLGGKCDSKAIGPEGVIGVFGAVGLGPGEFSYPRVIESAPDGRIFVIDKAGRVQRFAPDGTHEITWSMPETTVGKPVGLGIHPDGRLFVADTHYSRVLVYSRDGELLGSFGEEGTGAGQMQLPTDVAIDKDGYLYVSEYQGNDRITKWSPSFEYVTAFGEEPIEGERLKRPAAMAFDHEQTLWVADACNHRIVHFSRDGRVLGHFGSLGREAGDLRYPYDLCITPDDKILVCEYEGCRLQWFDHQGTSLRSWGTSGWRLGELRTPWGVTIGERDRIYVLDSLNSRVQIIEP
jgi:DNA-binding beta-propeller fold protein YncE